MITRTSSKRFERSPSLNGGKAALTLVELLVVIGIISLLAALLLNALSKGKPKAFQAVCSSNLRQVGLAFQGFAYEHKDQFPAQVSTNNGGALEFVEGDRLFAEVFQAFACVSNEVASPKLLHCPADVRSEALNFAAFRPENLSYFVGVQASPGHSDSVLAGDRNLAQRQETLQWTTGLHNFRGNVLFADVHVENRAKLQIPASEMLAYAPGRDPGVPPIIPPAPKTPSDSDSKRADPESRAHPEPAQPGADQPHDKEPARTATRSNPALHSPALASTGSDQIESNTSEELPTASEPAGAISTSAIQPEPEEEPDSTFVKVFGILFPIGFAVSLAWALVLLGLLLLRKLQERKTRCSDQ